ncbi:hypothetical protein quinque_011196 [Culex quinquefasciatus]
MSIPLWCKLTPCDPSLMVLVDEGPADGRIRTLASGWMTRTLGAQGAPVARVLVQNRLLLSLALTRCCSVLVFVGCSPDVLLVLGSMGLFISREGPVSQTSRAAENVVIAGCYSNTSGPEVHRVRLVQITALGGMFLDAMYLPTSSSVVSGARFRTQKQLWLNWRPRQGVWLVHLLSRRIPRNDRVWILPRSEVITREECLQPMLSVEYYQCLDWNSAEGPLHHRIR